MAPANCPCVCVLSYHLWVAGLVHVGGSFVAAGVSFVGTVVTCRGLCGQWLARADGEKWLSSLKNNGKR